jgi:hypothetical protein
MTSGMSLPLDPVLLHPDAAVCEIFRARFAGLPRMRTLTCRYEELGATTCIPPIGWTGTS